MAQFDHSVIEIEPGSVPRLSRFEAEIAAPAELSAGAHVGRITCLRWRDDGDHLVLDTTRDGEPWPLQVLVRHADPQSSAFLRTPRWNVSYRGEPFDRVAEALLREVAARIEAVAARRQWDAASLRVRFFTLPAAGAVLELSPGRKLYLRVTDHCDENCVFCNAVEGNDNVVASRQRLRKILARLPAASLRQVIFSGGEPTLVRALPELVAMACDAGATDVIIQTNGVALATPGALERYLPYRDRLGIGFSLHAMDAALSDLLTAAHDVPAAPLAARWRGSDDARAEPPPPPSQSVVGDSQRWAAKIAAIDRAVALGFRVKITCVVMRPNLAMVPGFAEAVWARWGGRIDRLQFSYAMPRGNAAMHRPWWITFAECRPVFVAAFEVGRRTGMRVETSQSASPPPCVLPDYLEHYDIYGDFSDGRVSDRDRVKPPELCGGCALDRICSGVWTRYLAAFGSDEIHAVRDRPPLAIDIDDYAQAEVVELA